ncbi:sugar O-acyltransferase, sialic acid O-acetyltransferase NeuD family [Lachnospiraceae bacterium XBB2008]|nr:sugar O-acyltransferase, sialic acid O-acetyltransferase NeuD family [Lachnospiraceae bacterium XBB2008]
MILDLMSRVNDSSSKKIVLLGGGGHCASVIDALDRMNMYDEVVILDPNKPVDSEYMGCKIAGGDDMLQDLYGRGFRNAFVSLGNIGDTSIRRSLYEKILQLGFTIPNIIDPSAVVSGYAQMGYGIFVGKNAVINAGAVIGNAAIINTGSIVEHNCTIGEFTHISVGSIVCGDCMIGKDVFVGAGSTIVNGVTVEDKKFIKAASLVKERDRSLPYQ